MNWYYVNQGQQVGPIDDDAVQRLVGAGAITADTLVWNETMTDWQPYSAISAGAAPGQAPPVTGNVCSQCGRPFPAEEMIQFGGAWVCAECKPMFVQRLKEGGGVAVGGPGLASAETILGRDYQVSVGDCLNRAWEMYKQNFGSVLGTTVLVGLLVVGMGMVPFGIGALAQLILQGPLMGGLYLFYAKHLRGGETSLSDVFEVFKGRFVNLMLGHIVTGILAALCVLPGALMVFAGVFTQIRRHSGAAPDFSLFGPFAIVGGVLLVIGICAAIYLQISWIFTLPLVADKHMGFWGAMELSRKVVGKHWWMTFWLMFVGGLIAVLGLLGCIIGILFTVPITLGMTMALYEQTLGDLAPAEA